MSTAQEPRSSAQRPRRSAHTSEGPDYDGEPRYHHGRSPAAWTGSVATLVAVIIASVALLFGPNFTLLIVAGVVLVVGLIAARALQVLGKGNI